MNATFDLSALGERVVYVKPVAVADLPQEIREKAGPVETLFAVHDSDGQQLALVANRALAFLLARQHDMTPVTVH
ncbi:MAG: putative small protein [Rhodobacteraceae bacterium HLUCCA08]|nr:MAG: putative small protein [Rhodobacteraceae bacterium HLUCCA08]